jgi:hypothetical protein
MLKQVFFAATKAPIKNLFSIVSLTNLGGRQNGVFSAYPQVDQADSAYDMMYQSC